MTDRITAARSAFAREFTQWNMIADGVLAVIDALKAWDAEAQESMPADPPWLDEARAAGERALYMSNLSKTGWLDVVRAVVVLAVARKHGTDIA